MIHVISIEETRNTDKPLDSEIAEVSGLNNPNKANKVRNTAICAIILFWFFMPLVQNNKTIPKNIGIKAVIDWVELGSLLSYVKYAQSGIKIKIKEFIRFAFDGCILIFLK